MRKLAKVRTCAGRDVPLFCGEKCRCVKVLKVLKVKLALLLVFFLVRSTCGKSRFE